jgi:hypothetical protein
MRVVLTLYWGGRHLLNSPDRQGLPSDEYQPITPTPLLTRDAFLGEGQPILFMMVYLPTPTTLQ